MPRPKIASKHSGSAASLKRGLCLLLTTLLAATSTPVPLQARLDSHSEVCTTYPDRVVDELAMHQQNLQRRARLGLSPLRDLTTVAADVGEDRKSTRLNSSH